MLKTKMDSFLDNCKKGDVMVIISGDGGYVMIYIDVMCAVLQMMTSNS